MQYEISCVNIRGWAASRMIDDDEREKKNRKVSGRGSRKSQKDESSETPSSFCAWYYTLVFIFVEANIVRFGRAEPLLYIHPLSRRDSLYRTNGPRTIQSLSPFDFQYRKKEKIKVCFRLAFTSRVSLSLLVPAITLMTLRSSRNHDRLLGSYKRLGQSRRTSQKRKRQQGGGDHLSPPILAEMVNQSWYAPWNLVQAVVPIRWP